MAACAGEARYGRGSLSQDLHQRLCHELRRLNYEPVGNPSFGWNNKSIGSEVRTTGGGVFWAKMFSTPKEKATGRDWEGEKTASHWPVPWKPKLHHVYEFGEDIRTQLIIADKVAGAIIGGSQHKISPDGAVSDEFLIELREALRWLQGVSTDRVNTRFDLVRRRVSERWAINLDYADCVWETIHGDLHWKNIAGPQLEIIDWEGWGIGLQHQDLAFLIAISSLDQILARRIRTVFRGSVSARSLTLAELFVTAELLRAAENYGEHPDLVPALTALGIRARDEWLG